MQNYKVRVNNESESKEVQELFFELGYEWKYKNIGKKYHAGDLGEIKFLCADNEMITSCQENYFNNLHSHKELTIQQLHDLVVLHRNDVGDANMQDDGGFKWLVNKMGSYVFDCGRWIDKTIDALGYNLKPISKKEYLTKQADGIYQLTIGSGDVEVPDGANFYYYFPVNDAYPFYKDRQDFNGIILLWERQTSPKTMHTRFAQVPVNFEVEQTLQERQSQYGDFSDVAELTQGLLSVMSKYGYDDMPNAHKESIHMIASKLARIVNGDCDYIENWHDISGYATLMERELKTKEGATNAKVIRTKIINGIMQEI